MAPPLRSLSDREHHLYKQVIAFEGTIEAKAQQLASSGICEAYKQVHRDYWQLARTTSDEATRVEALKRLLFLNFYVMAEPGIYSGVDVDQAVLNASFGLLEDYAAGQRLDTELRWMLASYAPWLETFWPVLGLHLPAIEAILETSQLTDGHQPERQLPIGTMANRGQMGIYWQSRGVEVEPEEANREAGK